MYVLLQKAFESEVRWGRVLLWRISPAYAFFVNVGVLLTMLDDVDSPINTWLRNHGEVIPNVEVPAAPFLTRRVETTLEKKRLTSCHSRDGMSHDSTCAQHGK